MTATLTQTKDEIAELAKAVLSGTDFFLVGVEIKGINPPQVWIYADNADRGINMDECAELSDELGFLIDAHEIFPDAYRLNVSSPGMKRALVDRRQYPKNRGRKVKVKFRDNEGYHKLEGILQDFTDDEVVILPDDREPFRLTYDQIVETKIIPSLK